MGGAPHQEKIIQAVFQVARISRTLKQIVEKIRRDFSIELTREQVRGIVKSLRRQAEDSDLGMRKRLLEVGYKRTRRAGNYRAFVKGLSEGVSEAEKQRVAGAVYQEERALEDLEELRKERKDATD